MHSSGSIILTVVERIRGFLDEPASKYPDAYIVNHVLAPSLADVLARLALNADGPPLARITLNLEVGTRFYQVPAFIAEVWFLARFDEDENITADWKPRGSWHPSGPGWRIEGNVIVFEPALTEARAGEWRLVGTASGDFCPHYAKAGAIGQGSSSSAAESSSSSSEGSTGETLFTLDAAPTLGILDQRPNAYAGAVLRILRTAAGGTTVWEERAIGSHDAEAGTVEVLVPFEHYQEGDVVHYEVVCQGWQSIAEAVAARGAMKLGTSKDVSAKKMTFLRDEYRHAMKTAGDRLAFQNIRSPKSWDRATRDNPHRRLWFLGGTFS
jgi:hypothetical protein